MEFQMTFDPHRRRSFNVTKPGVEYSRRMSLMNTGTFINANW